MSGKTENRDKRTSLVEPLDTLYKASLPSPGKQNLCRESIIEESHRILNSLKPPTQENSQRNLNPNDLRM